MATVRTIRMLGLVILAGLLAGCASHRASFTPAEPTGYSSMGYRATLYDVTLDDQRLGIVKIYSEGGYKVPQDGSQPVIDVRLRIRNLSDAPMSLDLAKSDVSAETSKGEQTLRQPLRVPGETSVPAGGTAVVVLNYPLEGNLRPDQVGSFDFDWTLRTDKGDYAQTTPFVRRYVNDVYSYYPLYGGWWGPGWGPGWGWWGPGWGWGYGVGFAYGGGHEEGEHGGREHGSGEHGGGEHDRH
jgi:hypothetical protein